jgi:hypothetical protein
MAEGRFCQSCEQRRDCRQIYAQIGNVKGPSVALSVFLVFLLPIAVFIGSLAVSQGIFTCLIRDLTISTLISVLFSAAMSFVVIFVVKSIIKEG